MSDTRVQDILDCLARVEHERARRSQDPHLAAHCHALKTFQQSRFRRAYDDLLHSPRYAGAAHFFLDELYGPRDYSRRDAQFRRIVPPLVKLFPREVVGTVHTLARLHALSEELDSAMAHELKGPLDATRYVQAWIAVGRAPARREQIELTLEVGRALDTYTRKPLLRQALRMMRGPASAAGLQDLQRFLECGFDTFKAMKGADDFLERVATREQQWADSLFAGDPEALLPRLMNPQESPAVCN